MTPQKSFKYDVLIGEEDFCDRKTDIRELFNRALRGKRTILFAPRRYGKTSLVKNVVGKKFIGHGRRYLLLAFDFMDVGGLESVTHRVRQGLSNALSRQMPVRRFFQEIVSFLRGIRMNVESDPLSGTPSISLSFEKGDSEANLSRLLDAVQRLATKYRVMLVLDEFHDIAFVPEAQAIFRAHLQELAHAGVFILGSKKHLLSDMFLNVHAPFFQYGDEMHLAPVSAEDWLPYFRERLDAKKITISLEEMKWLCAQLCDVPNAICEVGAWLADTTAPHTRLSPERIQQNINVLIENKQTFPYFLRGCTDNDRKMLTTLAHERFVPSPYADAFLKKAGLPKSTAGKVIKKLLNRGMIEEELERGYRVSDPLLGFYLDR